MDYQEFCINKFIQEGIPGMVEDLKAKNLTADEAGIKQWISDKHYTNSLIFVELKILEDPYYRKRACMILFTFKYYRDEVPIGFPKYAIITVLDHKSKSDAGYYILERQSNDSWQILICDDMVDSDYSPIADYKTIEEFANAVKELIYKRTEHSGSIWMSRIKCFLSTETALKVRCGCPLRKTMVKLTSISLHYLYRLHFYSRMIHMITCYMLEMKMA